LEVFRRNTGKGKARVNLEAEPAVVPGISKQYTARRALITKDAQSFARKTGAHAAALMLWHD
jgi:hypothetical protein